MPTIPTDTEPSAMALEAARDFVRRTFNPAKIEREDHP